jgi:hypothetical protein
MKREEYRVRLMTCFSWGSRGGRCRGGQRGQNCKNLRIQQYAALRGGQRGGLNNLHRYGTLYHQ